MGVSISVRALGPNNDPQFGQSKLNYITNQAAVVQIIATTLKLLLGEWWENLNLGLALFQVMVGAPGSAKGDTTIMNLIQQCILGCPYVVSIDSITYISNSTTRASFFTANVQTQFGMVTVTNAPGTSATVTS